MKKVICPFCKSKHSTLRGEGCCNCEYTGLVLVGEGLPFETEKEAQEHDPGISLFDLKINRALGKPLNFKWF